MKRRRLFFALWPGEAVRGQLAGLQARLPAQAGNWVHRDDLHLTLQFLGGVAPSDQACIADAAGAVRGGPFELVIDRLDYWPKPRILWAGMETPVALDALVRQLGEYLDPCGFPPERRPYRPHVTLLRKATPVARQVLETPIHWWVDHFVLVESRPGGDPPWYRVVEGWPLEAG